MRYEWLVAEPSILLLSTSDTDLISARSSGKNYRWANPSRLSETELPDLLAEVSIVVVRILGGYRAWQSGIDMVIAGGIPTVLVSGEQAADAELTGLSSVAAGIAVQTHIYLAHGGVDNLRQLHAFLSDTVLMTGFGFTPPVVTPTWGVLERPNAGYAEGPTIAVLYYRAQHLAGNTAYIESLRAGPAGVLRVAADRRTGTAATARRRRRHGGHRAGRRGIEARHGLRRWR
jgi:cobaltochelatase CobN